MGRQVFTLDHVSGGRVELGLGAGIRNDPSCAMGPRMMRLAARNADIWNSLSFLADFADQVDEPQRHRSLLLP